MALALRCVPAQRATRAYVCPTPSSVAISRRASRAVAVGACAASRRDVLATTSLLALAGGAAGTPAARAEPGSDSMFDFTVEQYGEAVAMSRFRNEVVVVVNVASE